MSDSSFNGEVNQKNREVMFAYSYDEENFYGQFDSREGAIAYAFADDGCERQWVYVGECQTPQCPASVFRMRHWLEVVEEHDHYYGEWSSRWLDSLDAHTKAIEQRVQDAIREYLVSHNLMPKFYCVNNAKRYSQPRTGARP